MNKNEQKRNWELLENLYMEDVIVSYIISDKINIKGIHMINLNIILDKESLILSGGDNIEIIYPLDEVADFKSSQNDNNYILSGINGERIEIAIT